MRRAMAEALVGDDVFGDDPTVNRLQEAAAALMGKEAGLFVPTGTMSNTIAICTHTRHGDEVLMDSDAHSMLYEVGAPAVIGGVTTRQFHSRQGVPEPDEIRSLIHGRDLHAPGTTLIVLENTHNRAGGAVIPLEVHRALKRVADEAGIPVHLDGARLFNAQVATGTAAAEYAAQATTVTFCLSKGLGCPVGSVLCGPTEFVAAARRVRKMLGGGMRQAGVLAAAGLYALEHNVRRLAEDHANAQRLAAALVEIPGISLDPGGPATNMVYFDTVRAAPEVVACLRERGVLCNAVGPNRIRMVTHLDVDADDVDRAAAALREAAPA